MKSGLDMHLPKEDSGAIPEIGDLSLDLDLGSIFGSTSKASESSEHLKPSLCPECLNHGQHSILTPFQLNFEEAIYLCPVQSCVYPMKEDNLVDSFMIKRDASAMPLNTSVRSTKKSRKSSGYSTFFEEFDPDVDFPDFNSSQVRPSSPMLDGGIDNPTIAANPLDNASEHSVMNAPPLRDAGLQNISDSPPLMQDAILIEPRKPETGLEERVPGSVEQASQNTLAPGCRAPPTEQVGVTKSPQGAGNVGGGADVTVSASDQQTTTYSPMEVEPIEPPINDSVDAAMDIPDFENKEEVVHVTSESEDDLILSAETLSPKLPRPATYNKLIQWTNELNSCWLDAIMQILVSSVNARAVLNTSESVMDSLLKKLFLTYDKCQNILKERLSSSQNGEDVMDNLNRSMSKIRNLLLKNLKKTNSFESGEFQSLLEMFPLVLKCEPALENLFKTDLLWDFECEKCGHRRARRSKGDMVSLPNTMLDFHPLNAKFVRQCYECKSPGGITSIYMERLSPCLMFHFQRGLPHSNLRVMDFAVQGHLYSVYALVQYVLSPIRHFVTWIRDIKTNKWLCCNDLESPICTWQAKQPKLPPNEIHMVFFERQLPFGPLDAQQSDIATVSNEEVVALAKEIPLELFFAHEGDETIVIQEDGQSQSTSRETSNNHGHASSGVTPTIFKLEQCHVTPQQNQMRHHSTTPFSGTENLLQSMSPHTATAPAMPAGVQDLSFGPDPTKSPGELAVSPNSSQSSRTNFQSFQFSPSMFTNGGMTVLPSGDGRQMVQLLAPANTCSIFIVTNDNMNKQPIYIGPPPNPIQVRTPSKSVPHSFIDDPTSYNMVAQGIHGPVGHLGKRRVSSSNRPKRQYRLSGYSKGNASDRFSKPYSSSRSATNSVDALSEKSCDSKKDSETLSEVSELSDLFPDYEFETNSSRRSSVATSSTSMPNSHSTSPTNGI